MGASIDDDEKTYLTWKESQPFLQSVRNLAFEQLRSLWQKYKDLDNSPAFWGDEVEHTLVSFDHKEQKVSLGLQQHYVLEKWNEHRKHMGRQEYELHPEGMRYMVETVAAPPLGPGLSGALHVEHKLAERRKNIESLLGPEDALLTLAGFPRVGAAESFKTLDALTIEKPLHGDMDLALSGYKRWKCLGENIKARRERDFDATLPVFQDRSTTLDEVVLDKFGYAPGVCALQVTFQAKNVDEACQLHDQLSILGPLMMALTAATPAYQGFLVETDTRWNSYRHMADERSPAEVLKMEKWEQHEIDASLRACTSPIYLSKDVDEKYQSYLPTPSDIQEELQKDGMNKNLASHFARFLQYDPLLLEADHLEALGPDDTYHLRTLYNSLWPHVRVKLPVDENAGWRVEFRPMEVQLTDFETAAFIVFMVVLRHAMEQFHVNLYVPMKLVVENMQRAMNRNAVLHEKFWFRTGDWTFDDPSNSGSTKATIQQLSLKEIFCGSSNRCRDECCANCGNRFPGFIPLINAYLDSGPVSDGEKSFFMPYIQFVGKRASGQLWTDARWMRHMIQSHPSYRNDSVVTPEICYELCCQIKDLSKGKHPQLF